MTCKNTSPYNSNVEDMTYGNNKDITNHLNLSHEFEMDVSLLRLHLIQFLAVPFCPIQNKTKKTYLLRDVVDPELVILFDSGYC